MVRASDVVRRSDGTPIFGSDADSINPGEHYYIAIYQGGGDGAKSCKEKLELTSGEKERIEIQGPTVGMAEAIGISKELLGQLVEPLGLVFAFLEIPMHMIDLGRGPHPPMAVARAHCYAKTAFAWMEEESGPPPTSSVFDFLKYNKLVRYQDLYPIVQKAWRDSWIETVEQLTRQFDEARIKIYMEVSSRGGNTRPLNVKSLRRLAKRSLQQEHGSAAEYCMHCLNDVGKANWWKNYFPPNIKPLWDLQTKTPYPD